MTTPQRAVGAWVLASMITAAAACGGSAEETGGGAGGAFNEGGEGGAAGGGGDPHGLWVADSLGPVCTGHVQSVCEYQSDIYVGASTGLWRFVGDPAAGPLTIDGERVLPDVWLTVRSADALWAAGLGLRRLRDDGPWEILSASEPFEQLQPVEDGVVLVHGDDDSLWVWRDADGLRQVTDLGLDARVRTLATTPGRVVVRTTGGDPWDALWSVDPHSLDAELLASGDEVIPLQVLDIDANGGLWGISATTWGFFHHYGQVVRSLDGGGSFEVAPGLPPDFEAAQVITGQGLVIVVEAELGRVLISEDGGESYRTEDVPQQGGTSVTDVVTAHLTSAGTVFVGGWCHGLVHRRQPLPAGL